MKPMFKFWFLLKDLNVMDAEVLPLPSTPPPPPPPPPNPHISVENGENRSLLRPRLSVGKRRTKTEVQVARLMALDQSVGAWSLQVSDSLGKMIRHFQGLKKFVENEQFNRGL